MKDSLLKKKATRADVAERAEVSQTTVAYVMSDTKGVKEATRQRVLEAARELGYQPTFSARCMKKGKTELIGIMIPGYASQFLPFYSQMIQGVCDGASDSNYHFIYLTQDREEKSMRCLREHYLDGVIYIQSAADHGLLNRIMEHELPVVTLNQLSAYEIPQVSMDYEGAMEQAVAHHLKRDFKRLLFLHGDWENQPLQRYRKAYDRLAREHMGKHTFSSISYPSSVLDHAFFENLDSGAWDALIVDGFECARAIVQHWNVRGEDARCPMVVFSESTDIYELGDNVRILQSQAYETGKRAWSILSQLLDGRESEHSHCTLPFLPFNFQSKNNPTK